MLWRKIGAQTVWRETLEESRAVAVDGRLPADHDGHRVQENIFFKTSASFRQFNGGNYA